MKQYEKYKSTGIEWIGEIPSHWNVKKLAHGFNIIGSGTTPTSGNPEYYSDGEINWLQTGDLTDGIISSTSKKITQKALEDFSTLRFYMPDSLVIAMYGATIGKTGVLNIESTTNQACCVLSEAKEFESKFVFYWFNANKNNVISLSYGGGQPNISQEIIRSIRVPCPPRSEQSTISFFLDEKTSQIDKLISNKQKLIELLKEERISIIDEAVTRGIGPKVKLKPSGIEWIGVVPQHWMIRRVSTFGNLFKGRGIKKDETKNEGFPCIRYGEIYTKYDRIVYKTISFIDEETSRNSELIKKGDVLFAGSGETVEDIGKTVVYFGDTDAYAGGDIIVLRLQRELDSIYASYLFNATFVQTQKSISGKGEIIVHIYPKNIREILVPLPPKEEQILIVDYLNKHTEEIDSTVSKIEKEIALMLEYRTALISEAVTGKIKVI